MSSTQASYQSIRSRLLSRPAPLLPLSSALDGSLTDAISSLRVHPALEAGLHLLNHDLYSAHFLCRHMQATPAHEGMFLHGILHRIEGDYDNARAWYRDVSERDVFRAAWGGQSGAGRDDDENTGDDDTPLERALRFISQVEALKKAQAGSRRELLTESGREIEAVLEFCERKFGTDRVDDASRCWAQPQGEHKKLGQDMVSGDKGHRNF